MIMSIEYPDDEHLVIKVNGEEVAWANHDRHGWDGINAVEDAATAVARALGATVVEE